MLDKDDGFKKSTSDAEVEGRIAAHCARFAMDPLTAVKHFPVLARRQLLKRFLAHVELFNMKRFTNPCPIVPDERGSASISGSLEKIAARRSTISIWRSGA